MSYLIVAIIIAAVAAGIYTARQKEKNKKVLKAAYDEALQGTDKARALAAGRAYYASLRPDGKLSMYDEQALTNDLNTMKNQ